MIPPGAGEKPAIRLRGLCKVYDGVTALDGVDLDVRPGEMLGLLGPNGAGKTTLISIVTGLVRRTAGEVEVFGMDVTRHYRTTRSLIGVVPQELINDRFFTVRQALRFHSGFYGVRRNEDWIELLLERLALKDHAHKKVMHLSGGMKRRLLVAKAMVHRPRILILDEPTAGVDVELRRGLWTFVREMHARGTTVLLTTHYIEEAEEHCSRVAIIHHGRIVAMDETHRLVSMLDHRRLSLVLDRPARSLPPGLDEFQPEGSPDGLHWTFTLHDAARDVERILAAFRGHGLPVRDVDLHRADLEDVFVALTGVGPGGRPAGAAAGGDTP